MRKKFISKIPILTIISLLISLISWNLCAQVHSSPVIQNYAAKTYQAHTQNWAIVQDQRGLIYVGNNNGVIQFDGKFWKIIETDGIARSLDMAKDGRIYVGTQANFGMLTTDSTGEIIYESLYDRVKPSDSLEFGDIWNTYCTDSGVYFLSNEILFRWHHGKLNYWKAEEQATRFHVSFRVGNRIFVKYIKGGLYELINGQIVEITGGAQFVNYHIFAMLDYESPLPGNLGSKDTLLLGTYRNGLQKFNLKTGELFPFKTEADPFFIKNGIYNGIKLPNGNYVFGTLNGGAVVVGPEGKVLQYITERQGLQGSKIKSLMVDQDQNVWMALNYGFSKVEINSPWTKWGKEHGLDTKIYSSYMFGDKFYVGTPIGAFVKSDTEHSFSPIEEITGQTWAWNTYQTNTSGKEALLFGNQHYFGQINDEKVKDICQALQVYFICASKKIPGRYYIGMRDGLGILDYKNGQWSVLQKNKFIDSEVRSCYELENGDLWISTGFSGLYYLTLNDSLNTITSEVQHYDTSSGLGSMRSTSIERINRQLTFGQSSGTFIFDQESSRFVLDSFFYSRVPFSTPQDGFRSFVTDREGNIWVCLDKAEEGAEHYLLLRKSKDSENEYVLDDQTLRRIPLDEVVEFRSDSLTGLVYIATSEGLYVYDDSKRYKTELKPKVLLRKIVEGKDSILFYGNTNLSLEEQKNDGILFSLPYDRNGLTFYFSSPSYIAEDQTEYSFYLEGFDPPGEWSDWTRETKKEYTNLNPNANYQFKVKARNIFQVESEIAVCNFTIRKPWFYEWYMILLYALAGIGLIYLIVKTYTYQLRLKNIKLERIVEERTAEINQKNLELEQYNEEIMAQRDQIEVQKQHVEEANEELNQINEEILAQRDQIDSQNKVLVKQNHDILSSISYAKRIQEAILPSADKIKAGLPDSFFYYKPRDIVSGDFYWMEKVEGKVLWAAVDCTGHGVPGAFMSILGANGLKQIVVDHGVLKPGEILEELTQHVVKSMEKTKEGDKIMDGMDVALCSLDIETGMLEFAGAYNSMYLIRNNKIEEIKGTRRPVGRFLSKRAKSFETQSIQLMDDDLIYVTSDGFQDQFGGEKGEKYTKKRLREFLVDQCDLPLQHQMEGLEVELDNWKGNLDQLDDICIIGVRYNKGRIKSQEDTDV